ncbi:6-pyruvoyl trahydropterin synthase family protein [Halorubrum kocurii]|uniref:6-pyruvoyltetrahydropterin synthase n=1 Tax=Halorubrum kocurii JCM 14978 TaxID=1230456 RepID=M0NNK8_9EURY|nr:6-carboxytetrahydropterin synthase [Halorubrum kocurii]EMA59376.1 6-pyruvoyltetrahydropterin synthase [Halorubrum kocurii JCM 14978]
MYAVTVTEAFVAQHYLTVPNPPAEEAALHSHAFEAEVTFRGSELGEHGYLLDIDLARAAVADAVDAYRDETLNEHLAGNPSVERLARALFDRLADLDAPAVEELTVAVHEDDTALVRYTGSLS